MIKTRRLICVMSCLTALTLMTVACSAPDEPAEPALPDQSTTQTQPLAEASPIFDPNIPEHHQFMMDSMTSPPASVEQMTQNPFTYTVPEGWREIAPTQLRNPNFQIGDEAEPAEAYVTMLGGEGGGLAMNINRWSGQMGGAPLSDEAIGQLEKITMLGQPVPVFEAQGSFRGMQGGGQENYAMLATAWVSEDFSVFVKMTGPEPIVTAHREAFLDFCRSLNLNIPHAP